MIPKDFGVRNYVIENVTDMFRPDFISIDVITAGFEYSILFMNIPTSMILPQNQYWNFRVCFAGQIQLNLLNRFNLPPRNVKLSLVHFYIIISFGRLRITAEMVYEVTQLNKVNTFVPFNIPTGTNQELKFRANVAANWSGKYSLGEQLTPDVIIWCEKFQSYLDVF